MSRNRLYRGFGLVALGVSAVLGASAYAQDGVRQRVPDPIPPGTSRGGFIGETGPIPAGAAEIIYDSAPQITPEYFFRTLIGYLDADDIYTTLPPHGGMMVSYTLHVFGSITMTSAYVDCPAEAAVPYTVTITLWSALEDLGSFPIAPIPGTTCVFTDVPKGAIFTLNCPVDGAIPSAFWLLVQFDSDCAGWVLAGAAPPDVGFSFGDFYLYSADGGGHWSILDFIPPPYVSMVSTMLGFDPGIWSCCDTVDNSCANVGAGGCLGATQIFTPGVLCNDLDPPCSAAGACCNLATGDCQASFEVDCTGYLEQFSEGETCQNVDCPVPDNVPTLSQWGMIVLTVLLLSGLTIKFSRRDAKALGMQI